MDTFGVSRLIVDGVRRSSLREPIPELSPSVRGSSDSLYFDAEETLSDQQIELVETLDQIELPKEGTSLALCIAKTEPYIASYFDAANALRPSREELKKTALVVLILVYFFFFIAGEKKRWTAMDNLLKNHERIIQLMSDEFQKENTDVVQLAGTTERWAFINSSARYGALSRTKASSLLKSFFRVAAVQISEVVIPLLQED